jgi:hypothetical protein
MGISVRIYRAPSHRQGSNMFSAPNRKENSNEFQREPCVLNRDILHS